MTNPTPSTPEQKIADALREVALRLEHVLDAGQRSQRLTAEDLLQTLLSVADELDPSPNGTLFVTMRSEFGESELL